VQVAQVRRQAEHDDGLLPGGPMRALAEVIAVKPLRFLLMALAGVVRRAAVTTHGHRDTVSPWRTFPGQRTGVPLATWRLGNAQTRRR